LTHNSSWDTAMSQFNAEGVEHVRDGLYFRKRRDRQREYTQIRNKEANRARLGSTSVTAFDLLQGQQAGSGERLGLQASS
jgi:hypothetical protein